MKIFGFRNLKRSAIAFLILIPLTFVAFPLVWMLLSSIKLDKELFSVRFLPSTITFVHFKELFHTTNFLQFFTNSVIVAILATLITIGVATLAAYSISRFKYRWNFERLMLVIYAIPPVLLVIPILLVFSKIKLANSYIGLALGHSTFMLPFSVLILIAYFNNIPKELDEAALVDGASRLRALFSVILPLAFPGLVSTAVVVFAFSWNDYVYAYTLTTTKDMQTLPLGIAQLTQGQSLEWGMLMAAAVLITLPILVFFLLVQRQLLKGFIFATTAEK